MKVSITLTIILAMGGGVENLLDMEIIARSYIKPILLSYEESSKGWFIPQHDGTSKWMTVRDMEEQKRALARNDSRTTDAIVNFKLYTRKNPKSPEKLITDDIAALRRSFFNSSYPTRFVIHGWYGSANTDPCYIIRDAFLAIGDYNVICVDWSDRAVTDDYYSAVVSIPGVGKQVAVMIDFLNENGGMPFGTLLLAGHSLGAHVAGYAGRSVVRGRVSQIIGMDPAYPAFSVKDWEARLNRNDADYVEIIHTDVTEFGFIEPIGTADFYPNGGIAPQLSCRTSFGCSHYLAYQYYAEAVHKNSFKSIKCETHIEAIEKKCGTTYSAFRMGDPENAKNPLAHGVFYVPVNSLPPYATSYICYGTDLPALQSILNFFGISYGKAFKDVGNMTIEELGRSRGQCHYNFIDYIAAREECAPDDVYILHILPQRVEETTKKPPILVKCLQNTDQTANSTGKLLVMRKFSDIVNLLKPIGNSTKRHEPGSCVLVLFYTPTSLSCAQVAPYANVLPAMFPTLRIAAIDAFEFQSFNTEFGIIGLPTLLLFHQGRPVVKFYSDVGTFSAFVTRHTGIKPVELSANDTELLKLGPLPLEPVEQIDYTLILAWAVILLCAGNYLSKTQWCLQLIDVIKRNWRESVAQLDSN